ncbi:MAG: menaquinone biosynthesis decarboxylase [Deferribacteraceae bacterium]|jgi:4-hydroxy-3-polyprenylbenzoate decarboxylase|nr:menaquinone biosynthesis decarboxylase [Deferribacteraceae bacterium]
MYRNLSEFIDKLEQAGELVRIKEEVDPILEVTEITDRVSKASGPALLFENLKGSNHPLLMNMFGSTKRMNMALGVEDSRLIGEKIVALMKRETPQSLMDKLKALPTLLEINNILPKTVSKGACKEVILKGDDIDVLKFPILKCWPDDGGRFITFPCVFTKDPVNGTRNCGMYRMQVYDKNTTGMHWHMHHQGADHYRKAQRGGDDKIEVAVALGGDPVITFCATAPVPDGVDEMLLAGFIREKPVEMIKCETVDVEVPADSEIVLEGYVDTKELRHEGPFGDHTGYYSLADDYPVFHITCITHRKNAIYPSTIVGKPPMEDTYMGIATGHIFMPLLKMMMPEVVNFCMPVEGVFHNILFISIDKKYPMHARKVMNSVWGTGQMMFTKMIVVVDKDVDVFNTSEVLYRMGNNVDWSRDIMISQGPVDALDHASAMPHWGGKIGIDATRKWATEGHTREWPEDITMSDDVKERVDQIWSKLGIKL